MTTTNGALEQYSASSLTDRQQYATVLASAGDLIPSALHVQPQDEQGRVIPGPKRPSPGKVLLVLETGAMLGLPPVAALQGIQVIEGKATLSAGMMSAVVRRAGHKLQVREEGTVEGGDLKVTATLIRHDDQDAPFTATWTPHKAARAGLCRYERDEATGVWRVVAQSQQGAAKPWQAYTEAMCRSRAIGEVCRQGAEDALYGVHYTPEEAAAAIREEEGVLAAVGEEGSTEPATKRKRRAPAKGKQGTRRETEPAEPQQEEPEQVVDAEVLPEEPADDVPMYAAEVPEQQAEEPVPSAEEPTDDGDVPPEEEPYELQAPEVVDTRTGTVYGSQAEMDAALKVEREERQAERAEAADPEPQPTENVDWQARLDAATSVAQVKAVWDATSGTPELTTKLRLAIIKRKGELEAP